MEDFCLRPLYSSLGPAKPYISGGKCSHLRVKVAILEIFTLYSTRLLVLQWDGISAGTMRAVIRPESEVQAINDIHTLLAHGLSGNTS